MLTELSTIKSRLGIAEFDLQYDALLTNSIKAVSARFDNECNRTLTRTVNALYEFDSADTEILPLCYPIESVTKFELKENESSGWVEQTNIDFLIRRNCTISLLTQLSTINSQPSEARITYTGGYVMPGTTPGAGQ